MKKSQDISRSIILIHCYWQIILYFNLSLKKLFAEKGIIKNTKGRVKQYDIFHIYGGRWSVMGICYIFQNKHLKKHCLIFWSHKMGSLGPKWLFWGQILTPKVIFATIFLQNIFSARLPKNRRRRSDLIWKCHILTLPYVS